MLIALCIVSISAYLLATTELVQSMGLSALPLAIILGILTGNLFNLKELGSHKTQAIFTFSKQSLLRLGIVLFGSQLTLQQIYAVGWQAALLDASVVISVLLLGFWFGVTILGMSKEITILTSVGSAICGAAAILATEPVLKAKSQHVSVAVATVVVFGTLALFSYPVIFHFTDYSAAVFGIYIGGTVHEVAQAVAAGQSIGPEAMYNAIIVKLMRVMMLAPAVIVIAWLYQRSTPNYDPSHSGITIPWFVLGFIAVVVINSWLALPTWSLSIAQNLAQVCLTIAMAALGLQTRFSAIREAGIKPLTLSSALFILLLGGGLVTHQLLY